jgi:signal peptidase I
MKPWMRWSLWGILFFGVLFGVLRYWVIDFYTVPDAPSEMINWANSPNLEPGDVVLVWRLGKPHIGDVVRCNDPSAPPEAPKTMNGRVIGIAGDKIELADGQLKINGFRVSTASCSNPARKVMDESGQMIDLTCFSEELGGSKHDVQTIPNAPPAAPVEMVVKPGTFFILSDNRSPPWTHDSREVGLINEDQCTQRLAVRLISKNGWGDSERRMGFLF